MKAKFSLLLLCAGIAGCTPATSVGNSSLPNKVPELMGPAPYITSTPADQALACVAEHRRKGQDLRLGIGEITDGTGARTFADGTSPLLTQRPDMMFAVAVGKTGVRSLNRNSTKVAEWELAQSMEQRLGEGFLRVHRNALVARSAVRALQRRRGDGAGGDEAHAEHWAVQLMPTGEWLAVSRRQLAAVREALTQHVDAR